MHCRQSRNIRPVLFQNVNKNIHQGVPQHFRYIIRRCRPELWSNGKWLLLHDNLRPHMALSIKEYLSVRKITLLPHAPYPPDLSPCDSLLFPWLNGALKGHCFADIQTTQAAVTKQLQHSSKCRSRPLTRPLEALEAVYWCRRKLFRRISVAPECKYSVLIFISSVSGLSRYGLCFDVHLRVPDFIKSSVSSVASSNCVQPNISEK
jgi:hypothetical protein